MTHKITMTAAETFWYVVMNLALGAAYLSKIPIKKAMKDYGLLPDLTAAEKFWYVLSCIPLGSGYFAKVVASKALSELPQFREERDKETTTLRAA